MDERFILSVYTRDSFLYQKIRLSMPDWVTVIRNSGADACDLCLVDVDNSPIPKFDCIKMSRQDGEDVKIPFSIENAEILFKGRRANRSELIAVFEERSAYLHGEKIKLTELEFSLLSTLIAAGGSYVSREELLEKVWQGGCDGGIINVYIHYLREKLEKHGEKIIISSRKCGYKVDEKYLGGDELA